MSLAEGTYKTDRLFQDTNIREIKSEASTTGVQIVTVKNSQCDGLEVYMLLRVLSLHSYRNITQIRTTYWLRKKINSNNDYWETLR